MDSPIVSTETAIERNQQAIAEYQASLDRAKAAIASCSSETCDEFVFVDKPSPKITPFENGLVVFCNSISQALKERATYPLLSTRMLSHALNALHSKLQELTDLSPDFLVILRDTTQNLETQTSGEDQEKAIAIQARARSVKLGGPSSAFKPLGAKPRPASLTSPARADEMGAKSPFQPKIRQLLLDFQPERSAVDLLKTILTLPKEDILRLETDRSTNPKIHLLYQTAIAEIQLDLTERKERTPAESIFLLKAGNLILHYPDFESLFPLGPYKSLGSRAFAALILAETCPLGAESARLIIEDEANLKPCVDFLWYEASFHIFTVFSGHMQEIRNRMPEETRLSIHNDIECCVHLATQYDQMYAQMSKAKGSHINRSVSTLFCMIYALDRVARVDPADLDRAGLRPAEFMSHCSQTCDQLNAAAQFSTPAPEVNLTTISDRLSQHQKKTFGKEFNKTELSTVELRNLFYAARETRKHAIEFLDTDARQDAFEAIRKSDGWMEQIITAMMQGRFTKDGEGARKCNFIQSILLALDSIEVDHPFDVKMSLFLNLEVLIHSRLNVYDTDRVKLQQQLDISKSNALGTEFARLKASAIKYENHSFSQFNRPTQTAQKDWWPREEVSITTGETQLAPSPASTACSCNATMTLVHLLTPGRPNEEAFDFDRVLNEGQFLFYDVLKREPQREGERYQGQFLSEDRTAGIYLDFEAIERSPVFQGNYLSVVEQAGTIDGKYIQVSLSPGKEIDQYKRLFTQLEARIPEGKDAIGGLIQNGVSIYAVHIQKTPVDGTTYTIIDSHGLYQGIPTAESDFNRAFKVSFKSIDDASRFLQLHHPYNGTDIRTNTCTVLPVIGPDIDLAAHRDRGAGLMAEASAYHLDLQQKQIEHLQKDKALLRQYRNLPVEPGHTFSRPWTSSSSTSSPLAIFKSLQEAERSGKTHEALRKAEELLRNQKISEKAKAALSAFVAASKRDNSTLVSLKTSHLELKRELVIDQGKRSAHGTARTPQERETVLRQIWADHRRNALTIANRHIK